MSDLRWALRMLWRTPGVTAAAVLALALGIGANTAIFSVVDGVLLRPLPFPDSQSLYRVYMGVGQADPLRRPAVLPAVPGRGRAGAHPSQSLGRLDRRRRQPDRRRGAAERVLVRVVAALAAAHPGSVQPVRGRNFLPEETSEGRNRVALIAHGLWQRQFAAADDPLARASGSTASTTSVVGRPAARLQLDRPIDVWIPLTTTDPGHPGAQLPLPERGRPAAARAPPPRRIAADLAAGGQRPDRELPRDVPRRASASAFRARPYLDAAGRGRAAAAVHPAGRGGLRPGHHLRQRRQPAAGPGGRPGAGDGHPHRAGRRPGAAGAPAADREPAAGAGRRGAGRAVRRLGHRRADRAQPPTRCPASPRCGSTGACCCSPRRWPSPPASPSGWCRPSPSRARSCTTPSRRACSAAARAGGRLRKALVIGEVALSLVLLVGRRADDAQLRPPAQRRSRLPPGWRPDLPGVAAGRRTARATEADRDRFVEFYRPGHRPPAPAAGRHRGRRRQHRPARRPRPRPADRHRGLRAAATAPTCPAPRTARPRPAGSRPSASPCIAAA